MKWLFNLVFTCFFVGMHAQEPEIIKVQKVSTCAVNLVADTALYGKVMRLSRFAFTGISRKKEVDDIREKLRYISGRKIYVNLDSICKDVRSVIETKRSALVAVKIVREDGPIRYDALGKPYQYVSVFFIYEPKKKSKNQGSKF
jgi:hypothetical protein